MLITINLPGPSIAPHTSRVQRWLISGYIKSHSSREFLRRSKYSVHCEVLRVLQLKNTRKNLRRVWSVRHSEKQSCQYHDDPRLTPRAVPKLLSLIPDFQTVLSSTKGVGHWDEGPVWGMIGMT